MTRREEYEQKTAQLAAPVIEENAFELVDVEYVKEGGGYILRLYVDKEGGITIDDCETVSRYVSDRLDEDDFIEEAYTLEVSSPGLDRPLKKDRDFERHLGERVTVRLFAPIPPDQLPEALRQSLEAQHAGRKKKKGAGSPAAAREWEGTLTAYDAETITVQVVQDTEMVFDRDKVALVRLAFDF